MADYTTYDHDLADLAAALGHPARVRLMRVLIARGPLPNSALVDALPLAQSTVSNHLRLLREAGLVHATRSGSQVFYAVAEPMVYRLNTLTGGLAASLPGRRPVAAPKASAPKV